MVEYRKMVSTSELKKMKANGEKIAMITAYDYPSAKLADEAGADMILVGDSLGMVVLGYDSTIPVTIDEMLHHTKAVTRAVKRSFVVADMPFLTYHGSADQTLAHAGALMQQGLAKAVKLEGGVEIADKVALCTRAGIPVVGHIGLTPQAVHQLGGYKVQGRKPDEANKLLEAAAALVEAGAFAIVLEMVPEELGAEITEQVDVPTIGIGAGRGCDGQVLVYHDVLQYATPLQPKFVKTYAEVGRIAQEGIAKYIHEVKQGIFPGEEHVFHMEGTK